MERQETVRVTDRQVIKSRQKKFFAFCLAILIGCMPTVNVMAETFGIKPATVGRLIGQTIETGDVLDKEVSGHLLVRYETPGGNDEHAEGYNNGTYIIESKFGLNKYTIVSSRWNDAFTPTGGRYELILGQYTPQKSS